MMKKIVVAIVLVLVSFSCTTFKKTANAKHVQNAVVSIPRTDSSKKAKSYKDVISANAITQKGVFKIHKLNERWYFEIPDSLMNRDMLIVNRIHKAPITLQGQHGLGGDWIGENLVQFSKGPSNKLFIKRMSYIIRSKDSSDNGMFNAVQNSSSQAIVSSFEIKAQTSDSTGIVIDVTDYLNTDNDIFSFGFLTKGPIGYKLNNLSYQSDRSYIDKINAYPKNIEIRTVKTYLGDLGATVRTYVLNSSLILLPKQPMRSRIYDKRVGYFTYGFYDYDGSQPVKGNWVVTRWRLEPKPEDIDKYERGELVEPKKPIVYYIDPATPKKWVPFLIQGVNDWQKAFEKAGFKNAIYALEAPKNDSTWSLEDANHSVIVYKSSIWENASGPQVSDPRSGEIIETHINWYHNVLSLLQKWYMVQAGPSDAGARKAQFDDALMGRLIRYVCAHEVGHTLGLLHNFKASSSVPVDSLRSKRYIQANGICPSIMDYSRFNYVAQPEDSLDREELIPRISSYDEWAIEWGYKWMPESMNAEEEKNYFKSYVTSRLEKNKDLWFSSGVFPLNANYDFQTQSEDIGDNAVKASSYGIKNLKNVVNNLKEWTNTPNEDYASLRNMDEEVVLQYKRYLFHVANIIGGYSWLDKNVEQMGDGISFPSIEMQKKAVKFLNEELFTTPEWLLKADIFRLSVGKDVTTFTNPGNIFNLLKIQGELLTKVMSYQTYTYLVFQQTTSKEQAYTIDELLTDLETGIWKELDAKAPVNIYRRQLQKLYIEQLSRQLYPEDPTRKFSGLDVASSFEQLFTDAIPVIKKHLTDLLKKINNNLPYSRDELTKLHLTEIRDRIKRSVFLNKSNSLSREEKGSKENGISLKHRVILSEEKSGNMGHDGCWNEDFGSDR